MKSFEATLSSLNLVLPPAPKPVAVYKTALQIGPMLFISGHGPLKPDRSLILGKVGTDLTLEEGKQAARQVGLAILSTVKETLGTLDRVIRIVKTLGMVNCPDDFKDHPAVINGFSELMKDVFGEDVGIGTRSAVGMNSLPGNIAVEIECQFLIRE